MIPTLNMRDIMSTIKKPARDFSSLEQSAGFQRRILGNYTITALYDGIVAINPEAFAGVTADKRQAALQRQLHPVREGLRLVRRLKSAHRYDKSLEESRRI